MYDVTVVGAGPAGNAAAKVCAEAGLRTLLLEREALPRRQVSDATMSPGAQKQVQRVFGAIPESVLAGSPSQLSGVRWYTPEVVDQTYSIPWCWRADLDHWMSRVAQGAGAELWEESRLTGMEQEGTGYRITVDRAGRGTSEVTTAFVIGADGAASRVRTKLFPGMKYDYLQQAQQVFRADIDLDINWYHVFLHPEASGLGCYAVVTKGDRFAISYAARKGRLPELMEESTGFLPQFGFDPEMEPEWQGRCIEPLLGTDLATHAFRPGAGNALLVGDAGGFMMNVSLEGIGPGIKSGALAAESVIEAAASNEPADGIFFRNLGPLLELFGQSDEFQERLDAASSAGDQKTWTQLLAQARYEPFYNDY